MAARRAILPLRSLLNRQCATVVRQQQRASSSSSTQALAYKALHRQIAPLLTEELYVLSRGFNINSLVVCNTKVDNLSRIIIRELLLAKISILGPKYFKELLAHHREIAQELTNDSARDSLRRDFHLPNLAISQALRKVLDITSTKLVRINLFIKLITLSGILKSARTGLIALPRSPLYRVDEVEAKEAEDIVDSSLLPPS
ncbi:hypothetical protein GQ44DRAFT_744332 [Phaeosphaeriaceae sp. PMI808]|nr:hypothetical protein GQ44DRAFT_744332 [Phaeosphaeriaceae sp. PMI808]